MKVEILKKNRKYFAAKSNGYKCKILIDKNSETLTVGTHDLMLNDISVRSKYGTDLIYSLKWEAQAQENAGICTLRHPIYNRDLVSKCKDLGGKWDAEEKAWIFSDIIAEKVEELDELYNSELINVEIKVHDDDIYGCADSVFFLGYQLAKATGRDSGASLGKGFALIEGEITSGGSAKNWLTIVRGGTVLRAKVPKKLVGKVDSDWRKIGGDCYRDDEWEIKLKQ